VIIQYLFFFFTFLGLGVGLEGAAGEKNMHDAEFTCALFRFIQLTCEGHNLGKLTLPFNKNLRNKNLKATKLWEDISHL
jgi:hypothetical protein